MLKVANGIFIKEADVASSYIKHYSKLFKRNPKLLPKNLQKLLAGYSPAKAKEILRAHIGYRTIGRDPKGYMYRAAKGKFTAPSGTETNRFKDTGLLWVSPSADAASAHAFGSNPTFRMKVPKSMQKFPVTIPEGDIRGALNKGVQGESHGMIGKFNPESMMRGSYGLEAVMDKAEVAKYIKANKGAVELMSTLKIPDGYRNHRALMDSAGNVLGTGIPLKGSLIAKHPVLKEQMVRGNLSPISEETVIDAINTI